MPHVLTSITIMASAKVHVVDPPSVPDPDWFVPGMPSTDQQAWGDTLWASHKFVLVPSVVSTHSWNLVFSGMLAPGGYHFTQDAFAFAQGAIVGIRCRP